MVREAAPGVLLVVDMQEHYLRALPQPARERSIAAVNHAASIFRENAGQVVWIRMVHDESWASLRARIGEPGWQERRAALTQGSSLWHLADALDIRPEDQIVDKTRHDGFEQDTSELASHVARLAPAFVAVAGLSTDICCLATARGAMAHGYPTVMLADATSASDKPAHAHALDEFSRSGGAVETVAALRVRMTAARLPHPHPATKEMQNV